MYQTFLLHSLYKIYYKFNNNNIDYSSTSLDVRFHEENGEELNITKVTPLSDAVGLSSLAHNITITNHSEELIKYKIKIVDNIDIMERQGCRGITIPREEINISIKSPDRTTKIYKLADLEEGVILSATAKPLEEIKYTVRIWVNNESNLPTGSDHHYHGLIQVVENDTILAIK